MAREFMAEPELSDEQQEFIQGLSECEDEDESPDARASRLAILYALRHAPSHVMPNWKVFEEFHEYTFYKCISKAAYVSSVCRLTKHEHDYCVTTILYCRSPRKTRRLVCS